MRPHKQHAQLLFFGPSNHSKAVQIAPSFLDVGRAANAPECICNFQHQSSLVLLCYVVDVYCHFLQCTTHAHTIRYDQLLRQADNKQASGQRDHMKPNALTMQNTLRRPDKQSPQSFSIANLRSLSLVRQKMKTRAIHNSLNYTARHYRHHSNAIDH